MTWYSIEITESCILGGAYHRLCRAFQHAFIAAGAPPEMALLAQRIGLDDTRRVFISPASVSYLGNLIDEYDGEPCACPASEDVTLVYGVPGAKASLLTRSTDVPATATEHDAQREGVTIYPLLPSRQAAAGL